VISLWIQQTNSITFCEYLGKGAMETLAMIRQAFGEESIYLYIETPNSLRRPKKVRQVKIKVKSMLIIFFDIKRIVHAEQSVPHTTMKFYGDCVKMCEDLAPNFGDKRTGCLS
jgi:hypothetical protein